MTFEQRQTLTNLKTNGITGYFYKGELRFRTDVTDTTDQNKTPQREFHSATRRITKQRQSKSDVNNPGAPDVGAVL